MGKIDTNNLTLKFSQAKELVTAHIKSKKPIMLWGPPGIGKSDLMREIAAELGRPLIDIRLSLFNPEDLKGYPYIDDKTGQMKFSTSNELPKDPDSNAIIFFDEVNAAPQATQFAMYQLVLDRKLGEYELPNGVSMVTAGNREEDRAGLNEMPKPLLNRLAHVEMQVDFQDWLMWAVGSGQINPEIIGFLSNFQDKLFEFNTTTNSRAFATPRSWSAASAVLENMGLSGRVDNNTIERIVAANVGYANALEFVQFRRLMEKIPSIDAILDGKDFEIKNKESSLGIQYAVIISLLHRLRKTHEQAVANGVNLRDTSDSKNSDNEIYQSFYKKYNNFFEFVYHNKDVIGVEFLPMIVSTIMNVYQFPLIPDKIPGFMKIIKDPDNREVFAQLRDTI
jgi:hypothetical protein